MGQVEVGELLDVLDQVSLVTIDTAPIIYFIEANPD